MDKQGIKISRMNSTVSMRQKLMKQIYIYIHIYIAVFL